jgi:hypothetical protein
MIENTTNLADDLHVDESEARDALDPSVGAGTPTTAPAMPVQDDLSWVGPARTVGLSPKAVAAIVASVLAYVVTQELVELPAIVAMLVTAALVGIAAFRASPGTLTR